MQNKPFYFQVTGQPQFVQHNIFTNAVQTQSSESQVFSPPPQQQQQQQIAFQHHQLQQMTTMVQQNQMSQPQQLIQLPQHQHHQQQTQQHQLTQIKKEPAPTVVVNPNAAKLIELPKIDSNQQLFSLNTLTNQITQLNPSLTTANLGPMERLLIVPAGINTQQLAQCLIQGQIHFNNIGQATESLRVSFFIEVIL